MPTSKAVVAPEDTVKRIVRKYVDKLSAVPVIKEILVDEAGKDTTIWVVIDAAPGDEAARLPIARAEGEIIRETLGEERPELWVLNPAEYDGDKLSGIIPTKAKKAWHR